MTTSTSATGVHRKKCATKRNKNRAHEHKFRSKNDQDVFLLSMFDGEKEKLAPRNTNEKKSFHPVTHFAKNFLKQLEILRNKLFNIPTIHCKFFEFEHV